MLSLKNFETQTVPAILKRGEQYFSNGNVTSIEEEGNGVWCAEVEGSETYSVEVTIKSNDTIDDYCCNCPYDGGICKHVVAVLFMLQNAAVKANGKSEINIKKDVFETLLKSVTHSGYQKFLRQYAEKNKNFKTEFELFFADKDSRIDVGKKYSELVNKLIKKYSAGSYINYQSSLGLSGEINKLLAAGQGYIAKNNFRDAFALARGVLKPIMEAITYCDDSDGEIGDSIDSIVELLQGIVAAKDVATNVKEELFDFLQKELEDKIYFDYGDFGYQLFSLFKNLAAELNKGDAFITFTNAQIDGITGQYDNYKKEFFKKELIAFLQQTGKNAEAEKMLEQNMDIVDVRMDVINKAIDKKDYNAAKEIIAAGIKIAEAKSHPGTVDQWKKELLRIANIEKDIISIGHYASYFAFDRGVSAEYYQQWKKTFTPGEWNPIIENYINETTQKITSEWNKSKNKFWQSSAYPPLLQSLAPIYILEKFWDRLLILVQQANNLNTTLNYHQYLVKGYSTALLAIYIPALEEFGIRANSRNEYADLVRKMKKIIKDIPGGEEDVLAVAKRLKERFSIKPRRPAMIEELDILLR